ncbi:MAG: transketolase [bacterium]
MKNRDGIITKCADFSKKMRRNVIELAFNAGPNGAHLGPSLSLIELTAVLYAGVLKYDPKNPAWENRDRFILSKGHGALGWYAALEAAGIITREQLYTFEQNNGSLPGQPSKNIDLGIEFSSGSLGLGLSYGVGLAIAARKRNSDYKTYVLLGNGECNEGSVWEAAMSAVNFKLSNIVAIIDANGMQSDGRSCDIMKNDLASIWKGFGWEVRVVDDGHNVEQIYDAFLSTGQPDVPVVIIAKTVKGKGISFMENNTDWHHNCLSQEQYSSALAELGEKA